jgi:hypothetical protein
MNSGLVKEIRAYELAEMNVSEIIKYFQDIEDTNGKCFIDLYYDGGGNSVFEIRRFIHE